MSIPNVQIIGGGFSDSEGNPLAFGTVEFELSAPCTDVTNTYQICNGQKIIAALDENGDVAGMSYLLANNLIISLLSAVADSFYWVTAKDENGQIVYGPNACYILNEPSPFNLNALMPANPGGSLGFSNQLLITDCTPNGDGTANYSGGVLGGASNAYAGFTFIIAGFPSWKYPNDPNTYLSPNNGTYMCTASADGYITLSNPPAISQNIPYAPATAEIVTNLPPLVVPGQ